MFVPFNLRQQGVPEAETWEQVVTGAVCQHEVPGRRQGVSHSAKQPAVHVAGLVPASGRIPAQQRNHRFVQVVDRVVEEHHVERRRCRLVILIRVSVQTVFSDCGLANV